jgi:hypothetical protein
MLASISSRGFQQEMGEIKERKNDLYLQKKKKKNKHEDFRE